MTLLVTGSIGIDSVRTPYGVREECLGGSSVYFAMAASLFVPVRLVGVVGDDCPFNLRRVFAGRLVDLAGLEVRPGSRTFRWAGSYGANPNDRTTDAIELNVLAEEPPRLPEAFRDSRYVFLANTHPALQLRLLDELAQPACVVADTMNCWIENEPAALERLLSRVNGLVLNDSEARLLTGKDNLVSAAREVLQRGLAFVVVKKGEHGSVLVTPEALFALPAYPTEDVVDPTGAGDSFAGGLLGQLARANASPRQLPALKTALAYGTVVASFTIEAFSLDRLQTVTPGELDERLAQLHAMTASWQAEPAGGGNAEPKT